MGATNAKDNGGAIYVIRSAEGPRYTEGAKPSQADVRRDVGDLLRAAKIRDVERRP